MRLGTTSYIIPADILPNVKYLADKVDDIEIVLFESDDFSNLPSGNIIDELRLIAEKNDLSYTIHLPIDIDISSQNEIIRRKSVEKCLEVINLTEKLDPYGYVLHIYRKYVSNDNFWRLQSTKSVNEILNSTNIDSKKLCVETLGYEFAPVAEIVFENNLSICLDIGHVWLNAFDEKCYLKKYLDFTKIVHLHGVKDGKDHLSVSVLPEDILRNFINHIKEKNIVLTLEVFNEKDFFNSINLCQKLLL